MVVCGGLQSARLAALIGGDPDPQIVPFRGEYFRLTPDAAARVRGLVYPVPDPRYPFLGIHLTRRIDGGVDVGPNAVLALALEGYRRGTVSCGDVRAIAGLARVSGAGPAELADGRPGGARLAVQTVFRRSGPRLPSRTACRATPARARRRTGAGNPPRRDLVDDFCITHDDRITMVRNAPSPAATSSLAIAEHICAEMARPSG